MSNRFWVVVLGTLFVFLPVTAQSPPVDVNADGIVGSQEIFDLAPNWKGPALSPEDVRPWQTNGSSIFYNGGNVGIYTNTPAKRLTIAGSPGIGTHHGDYQHLRIGGGNSSGFIYGSFPRLGDGIHIGYNYYADAAGDHQIIQPDGATSRVSAGYGSVALATGGAGEAPVDRLVVDTAGNVKIGTDTQLFAPGGEENLRIVRGVIHTDGTVIVGSGFTVSHPELGNYIITFDTPFSDSPSVTATVEKAKFLFAVASGVLNTQVTVKLNFPINENESELDDAPFHFIAIGPR